MSLINEIHNQKPVVRTAIFVLALTIIVLMIGVVGYNSLVRGSIIAFHTDPQEQVALLAEHTASSPNPLAVITRVAGSLTASIGSLFGFDSDAGFDKSFKQDTMQSSPHLLPLSQ